MIKVRVNLAGNEQIEVAVAVVVGPRGASAETTHLDARALSVIFTCIIMPMLLRFAALNSQEPAKLCRLAANAATAERQIRAKNT